MKITLPAIVVLALLQVPALTQVDRLGAYYADTQEVFQQNSHTSFTRISFELVEGMIIVQAEMEGRTGDFILDTGAPTLIVNEPPTDGRTETAYSTTGAFDIQTTRVKHFAWGGIEKSGIEAIALDISHLEESYQRKILGVIGYQIFSDREILIDGKRMQIILFNGRNNDLHRVGRPLTTLSFTLLDHLPVIPTRLGDEQFRFGLDSGCTANLLDEKVIATLSAGDYQILRHQSVQGFDQQVREVPVLSADATEVAGLSFAGMEYLLHDLSHLRESGEPIDGLLGYPFFQNLTFSINYTRRQLHIWKVHVPSFINAPQDKSTALEFD